ncbi:MAG: hypothetical protein WC777_03730 [Candidatus Gracilibacteria bacterium]|jgi:hypothetical protein
MTNNEQIAKILRMIEAGEASLRAARELLGQMNPEAHSELSTPKTEESSAYEQGENQIVEGVFDGQNMIGPNEKIYPVPANYASKSKLVEGDRLKLTILPNGSFMYKQISPIDRDFVKGTLVKEDGQFKVLANGKSYKVLLASVTYYKGNTGDEVTLITPKDRESSWGTIEAVIPQVGGVYNTEEAY